MLIALLQLVIGFALLVWAADRFVGGASALARNLGIPPLIIGLTIVGFGTSAPEMMVSAVASLRGNAGIALGNAFGSNIANIGLILGITALLMPIKVDSGTLRREYPILLAVSAGVILFIIDGYLSRLDGAVLLFALVAITGWMAYMGSKQPTRDPIAVEFEAEIPRDMRTRVAVFWVFVGIVLLPLSSNILVAGATTIAEIMGMSEVAIGVTLVAIGTSLPELAASMIGVMRKEHELALGNVIGSNLFNLLGVLGIAGLLAGVEVPAIVWQRDYTVTLALTIALAAMSYGFRGQPGRIRRREGLILLLAYIAFTMLVLDQEIGL